MFGLFKKKRTEAEPIEFNYDQVMVDLHSHVLPGIDDGAKNLDESMVLVQKMAELGIKKIIATPHIMVDFYRNDAESIHLALEQLKARVKEEGLDIKLEAAAEYYYDETFEERVKSGEVLTIGHNCVLFELSFVAKPQQIIPIIQKMKDKGYHPILAHPERYPYYSLEDYQMIKDWGCCLQINTISLTGYYGRHAKEIAEMLIDNNLVDYISSDMHHPRHAEALEKALRMPYLKKLIQSGVLKNMELL
ncbi:capsular biosynthesis protein [Mucilaginibacter sp. RS28]|uniref:protein-tyrosine-phosphatase n=1 Tax=Mucilaginibacter straminoryzae TaxID=2932774 RepID=A0A9X2BAH6_9SPHI|nr:CpsB/CapC family capsule biosynthesis tyrosine phosphatase [Mucilaginibacter straminoryzae]MCJ8208787.1 capsular biosynthesis protein [Mucilaginibacter straminoryzae]